MDGDYRAEGCDVMFNGPGGEVCIAWGNTTLWARQIATALNYWATPEPVYCCKFEVGHDGPHVAPLG